MTEVPEDNVALSIVWENNKAIDEFTNPLMPIRAVRYCCNEVIGRYFFSYSLTSHKIGLCFAKQFLLVTLLEVNVEERLV